MHNFKLLHRRKSAQYYSIVDKSPQVSETPATIVSPEPQITPSPTPPETVKESSIQDTSLPNSPPQVQQDVQVNTPSITIPPIDQTPNESANIEPETLEGTRNTIPADSKPPESPKPSSFGDLIGQSPDLSEKPAIHIDPIEPPKTQSTEPSVSPSSLLDPSLRSRSSDQSDEASDQRRLHANAVRKQKKEDNLAKILEFVQKNGKATNLEIRDFLHISQSTTTGYLRTLVNSGKLKKEGKAKATKYSL